MSKLPYSLEYILENTDTGYVDTMTVQVPVKKWIQNEFERRRVIQQVKSVSSIEQNEITITKKGENITLTDTYYNSKVTSAENRNTTLYGFSYRCLTGYLSIRLKHSVVKGKNEKAIIKDIKIQMSKVYHISDKYLDNIDNYICLGRIDYKRDYRFRSIEEYYLIKQIIDIAPSSIVNGSYKKNTIKDTDTMYMKAYRSKSNKTAEFAIYNKNLEQLQQLADNKINKAEYYTYQNTMRFEVRILNAKLNSLKQDGIIKNIFNYRNQEMAELLFNEYASQAFFTEPFYRLDIAKELINTSILYKKKNKMRLKLCAVLERINTDGYTQARDYYSTVVKLKNGKVQKNYSKFNRYIEKIKKLGINPLTFRTTWIDNKLNISDTTYKQLLNFTLAENCLEEEYLML